MAIDFDSQVSQRRDYRVSAFGLVSRTIDLWFKRILDYLILFGLVGIVQTLLTAALIYVLFGSLIWGWATLIGLDLTSAIAELLSSTPSFVVLAVLVVGLSLVGVVISAIVGGTTIKHSLDVYDGQERLSIGQTFASIRPRLRTLVLIQLALTLITTIIMAPASFYSLAATAQFDPSDFSTYNAMFMALSLLLVSGFVSWIFSVRLSVALAVPIVEDKGVTDSLRRAWGLTSGSFLHIFAGQFVLGLVIGIVSTIFTAPLEYSYDPFGILVAVSSIVGSLLAAPSFIFLSVLYRDLETRTAHRERDFW